MKIQLQSRLQEVLDKLKHYEGKKDNSTIKNTHRITNDDLLRVEKYMLTSLEAMQDKTISIEDKKEIGEFQLLMRDANFFLKQIFKKNKWSQLPKATAAISEGIGALQLLTKEGQKKLEEHFKKQFQRD